MPGHTEAAASVGWTRVGNQKVATKTEHRQQYRTNRDAVDATQKFICHLEGQRVLSKARSPFSSPVRPVQKSNGEWRLAVGCHSLGEISPAVSAAVPDTAELQYKPEPTAAQWYSVTSTANAFFSVPVAPACRPQLAFTWRSAQHTCMHPPQQRKHSPTVGHGLSHTAPEKGGAPDHLQHLDDIIIGGDTAAGFEKGKKII